MKRALIAGGTILLALGLLVVAIRRDSEQDVAPAVATPTTPGPEAGLSPSTELATEAQQGFLYGRITTEDGVTYQGRLRWRGDDEAFWDDAFVGFKKENPWADHVPPEQLMERVPITVFGRKIGQQEREINLGRPFLVRFGDIARIEAQSRVIRVTLKSGIVFELDRLASDDLGDGVRVWDETQGIVDVEERRIRLVEHLPTARLGDTPERLHGTVRTKQGDFTGFVQWDWGKRVGTDVLHGRSADDGLELPFQRIRAIARNSTDSSLVTLIDGREIELSGTREAGDGNRGIYVHDQRYGRVLIAWDAFERVDFSPDGSGPAFGDFPRGRPLAGSVTTRAGRLLAGMLVFDLDESEITETLDAPSEGVGYAIPFGLIASIAPVGHEENGDQRATVILHSGEALRLEEGGDLGEGNAGMLVFTARGERPEYVKWADVERVDFDRPPVMVPSIEGR